MRVFKTLIGIVCLATAITAQAKPGIEQAVEANNKFGFEFYKAVKGEKGKNRLLSPVSAFMALGMTNSGARDATEVAIRKTLAASHLTREELNLANQALLKDLNSRKTVELKLANSVWTREGFGLLSSFVGDANRYYDAEARELDFSAPEAAATINQWAADHTSGKIKKVVDSPLGSDFYLMNATYFKGSWTHAFWEGYTKPAPFKTASGTKMVQMMQNGLEAKYVKRDDYEVVELPYGERYESSMLVFVPQSLEKLEASLDDAEWKAVNALLEKHTAQHQVSLKMPKFEFAYRADLKEPLSNMGMQIAFTPMANFRDLTRDNIVLNHATQDTYIRLDEKGTEAAAVTVIGGVTSVPMLPHATVVVDRPFLVAIKDNSSGAILFLGSIVEP